MSLHHPSFSPLQALQLLKQGSRLQMTGSPALFRFEDEKVLVVARQFSARLSQSDFLELYEKETFVLRQPQEGIDEKKDEEYYAWRAIKQ